MLGLPRRYAHFIFALIQSGMTSAIAAGIASLPLSADGTFWLHWLKSWLAAWLILAPVVILAAPLIRALSIKLTRDEDLKN